jgi:EmrB/QacA subfamily drug resistance transporter
MAQQPFLLDRPISQQIDRRQLWLLLISLMASMFLAALNQALVAVATPRILADLGGFSLLSWVFTVYMLASTVVVPLIGKLSDIYGRRLFLIAGIVVFMVGSAGCGLAQSMPQLIVARAVQGFGGGAVFAAVFATLGDLFPPAERGKYIGLFTGTFTMASVIGPTVGGVLTDHAGWRWCFFLNIPVGLAALAFISANLPGRARSGPRPQIDFVGAALLSLATVALLLGLAWAGNEFGWGSPQTIGLFVASGAIAIAFILQERRHPEAIFPSAVFRSRDFVLANVIVFLLGAAGFGAIQYLPVFVQASLGASATASGLVTTPQSLGLLVTSVVGGQLLSRTGRYRYMLITGGILMLAATVLLQTLHATTPEWRIAAFMVVYGLGFGLIMPTMSVVIQNAVAHRYLGVATSSRQFFMQIGNVMGAAVFGVVLATVYASAFSARLPGDAVATIPPTTMARFEDPTLALDERSFAAVRKEVLGLPDGEALLAATLAAQRESVAVAIRRIFLGASIAAAIGLVLLALMREVPLRRTFGPPAAAPAAAAGATPAGPALPEGLRPDAALERPATDG